MTEWHGDRVEALFGQAADLPPQEQRALLDAACAGDPALRAAVERLLADDARLRTDGGPATFLISPLVREPRTPPTSPEADAGPALPPQVGRYRVLRLLGEGGMGAVYEAEQDSPRRPVALKVIRPGLVGPAALRRFAREAQILGLLHHPGIAAIYEAGLAEDGQPFFAMELVRGVPLDEYAGRHGLDDAARLGLLARVCDAVQHAHEHGVVHRDLKPSNVLVDETGQPKVLDFGVARGLDDALRATTAHTRTGQIVGTPSYMSPEQVAADPDLDRRSDVYTLGVILYELLAGRPPYPLEGLPLAEAVRVIREREPARLGALDRRLRGDVETIVAKALEKDRERRYPSAGELAADIRRHLNNEPILARPPSALYQLGKFARRHKALVGTTAAFLGLLLGGGAVTAWQAVRLARADRDQAVQQARRSQGVQDALAEAAALREQARAAAGDTGQWAEALAKARRAEALVEEGTVAPGLARRVADLVRELSEEQADRRLVARLERTRLRQADVNVAGKGRFAVVETLPAFREAFADYGLRHASTAPAEAAALLRRLPAAVRRPVVGALDDWLFLARFRKAPEVGWLERVLAAADPDDWRQRLRDAWGAKDVPAVERLAREVDVASQPPQSLGNAANILHTNGRAEAAVRLLRRAQEAYPGDFSINDQLGKALATARPPQPHEAIRFLSVAVALRPESAGAWNNLGKAFIENGRPDEAIAACRKAVGLKRDAALPYLILGGALVRKGRLDEAVMVYREAITHRPDFAPLHNDLGNVLKQRGDLPGAAACFRAALAIDPKYGMAHYNLGNALFAQGDHPGAAASYRRAVQIDPGYAEAHCNLGHALLYQGDFRGALAAYRKADEEGSRRKGWPYPTGQFVKECERYIELDGRLPAILKGEDHPAGAAERLEVALVCRYKGLHAAAVGFVTEAFAADPKLADGPPLDPRYWAACSAALAGRGPGEEAAKLRRQALAWLRADLSRKARALQGGTPQERGRLQEALRYWQAAPDLAGVRDAGALAALPAEERAAWQQLWAEVAAVAAKARDGK
jgi:tetratricopeptide (TPR) repeat protein/predicted Ser/Thr protein kinase